MKSSECPDRTLLEGQTLAGDQQWRNESVQIKSWCSRSLMSSRKSIRSLRGKLLVWRRSWTSQWRRDRKMRRKLTSREGLGWQRSSLRKSSFSSIRSLESVETHSTDFLIKTDQSHWRSLSWDQRSSGPWSLWLRDRMLSEMTSELHAMLSLWTPS